MTRRICAAFAAVIAGLTLAITPAMATQQDEEPAESDSSLTWSVQPSGEDNADGRPHWEFDVEPGEVVEDHAQVNNFSEETLTFQVYSHDAINTSEGGFTLQPADAEPVAVGAWIGLAEEVTVEAGESAIVPFSFTVPHDASPGDHAGGIVASITSQTTDSQGQQVLVDNRVGSRIYLRVDGAITPVLEITDLEVSYDRGWVPFSTGAATITYDVHNAGNVRLAGEQSISGHGVFGIGEHALTPEPLEEILPGGSVTVSEQIDGLWPLLRMTETVIVTPEAPQTSATVLPVVQASQSAQAWALPWAELIILGVLILLAAWSWWRRRRTKAKNAKQVAAAVAKAREELRQELQTDKPVAAGTGDQASGKQEP